MVAIELRAFLKRFEGYEEALFETQLVDVNARAAKENTWKEQCVEYCLLLSGAPNKTAMLQVREHATTDVDFYANILYGKC